MPLQSCTGIPAVHVERVRNTLRGESLREGAEIQNPQQCAHSPLVPSTCRGEGENGISRKNFGDTSLHAVHPRG